MKAALKKCPSLIAVQKKQRQLLLLTWILGITSMSASICSNILTARQFKLAPYTFLPITALLDLFITYRHIAYFREDTPSEAKRIPPSDERHQALKRLQHRFNDHRPVSLYEIYDEPARILGCHRYRPFKTPTISLRNLDHYKKVLATILNTNDKLNDDSHLKVRAHNVNTLRHEFAHHHYQHGKKRFLYSLIHATNIHRHITISAQNVLLTVGWLWPELPRLINKSIQPREEIIIPILMITATILSVIAVLGTERILLSCSHYHEHEADYTAFLLANNIEKSCLLSIRKDKPNTYASRKELLTIQTWLQETNTQRPLLDNPQASTIVQINDPEGKPEEKEATATANI
jgi:hypothetical protein